MTRHQLLQRLDRAWLDFKASYAGLPDDAFAEPGVTGTWSVKDIVAHVTTWEEETIEHLPAILAGRRPPTYAAAFGGIDPFNARRTKEKAALSLREVFRQQEDVHRRVIEAVEHAPEEALATETRFRRRLRLDTYGHYPTHAAAIRRWRAGRQI
jgi:hypothetical protein